jgi:hypothetical protein
MRALSSRFTAVAVVCVAACGGCDRGTAGTVTIDTLPNGTVIVRNDGAGVWDSSSVWRLVEDLRIGNAAGEGPAGFTDVSGLAVDGAGRAYVLVRDAQEIRVFDSTGAFVRRIGRKGQGPGEMQNATGLGWDRAGRLWVADPANGGYSVFDTTGRFIARRSRPSSFYMAPWTGAFLATGDLLDVVGRPGALPPSLALVRYDSALVAQDTLRLPDIDAPQFTLTSGGRMFMSAAVPYAPTLAWRIDPRGFVWLGVTAPYRLYQQRLTGDTVRIVERAYEPVSVSSAERSKAIEGLAWFTKQGGVIDESRIPAEKPAFDRFYVDDRGGLWVVPEVLAQDAAGGTPFDVFDGEGRYLGQLRAPWEVSGSLRPVFRGTRVHAVTTDADGVPYVVRARIER